MKKVVINTCFGGFGLSREGMMRYAELKGVTVYPYTDPAYASLNVSTYYLEPEDPTAVEDHRPSLSQYEIARDDPLLVQVVEEMGDKSFGQCAELKVVELPDGVAWEIAEYDGNEHIAESHRTWS